MVKPYALHVVHMAYGQSGTCSTYAYGQSVCALHSAYALRFMRYM